MSQRVVVTGMGLMSPIGNTLELFWENLVNSRSGIRRPPNGEINFPIGFVEYDATAHFSKMSIAMKDRVSQMALLAAASAATQANLSHQLGASAGVYFGTGMGGATTLEHAYSRFFGPGNRHEKLLVVPLAMANAPGSQVAMAYGVTGECQTYSTACSSSTVAIGEAMLRIRNGSIDIAMAGGTESMLLPGALQSWSAMNVLCIPPKEAPETGCRPFSSDRTGFAISEGAAVIVLEELDHALARGATPLLEILGYGLSNDATHITRPNPVGQAMAMRKALHDAKIGAREIGHINAHGTATVIGDETEARSIIDVFGEYMPPVTATKSIHGHAIGATGAIEFIAMALSCLLYTSPSPRD